MAYPEPQKLPSPEQGRTQAGGQCQHVHGMARDRQGLGTNPTAMDSQTHSPPFATQILNFLKQMAFLSMGKLLPVPSPALWVLGADVKSKYQQNDGE